MVVTDAMLTRLEAKRLAIMASGHAATLVMARPIARGVYEATALPVADGQIIWRQKFGIQMDE